MRVTIVAHTRFNGEVVEDLTGLEEPEDATTAGHLVEFAGRACYQSWDRPNPHTATVDGYLNHILDVEHFSVLEHGTVTFYIEKVSRSLTHEFVRHRHLSPSQLSQRFVVLNPDVMARTTDDFVVPPALVGDANAEDVLLEVWDKCVEAYGVLVEMGEAMMVQRGITGTKAKKLVREAARAVLPNMTPTAIVMTGNHRAWRHFIDMRATEHADREICDLAVEVFRQLSELEPAIYQDRLIIDSEAARDGRQIVVPR